MNPFSTVRLPEQPLITSHGWFDLKISLNPQKKFTLLCER